MIFVLQGLMNMSWTNMVVDVELFVLTDPDTPPPTFAAYERLWTEIPCYAVFRFIATLVILPQIAVNKQWRYIGDCSSCSLI